MVKKYFGGLMTNPTIQPNLVEASALWSLTEAMHQIQSQQWPQPPTSFPLVYQFLIDNFTGTRYYLSAEVGDDNNDGLSEATAFATYDKFNNTTSSNTNNIMLVVLPGSYNINPIITSEQGQVGISDHSNPRQIVCAPGRVTFNFTATSVRRDAAPFSLGSALSNVYGCLFKRNNSGKSLSYSTALFNHSTALFAGKIHNVVLEETNANGNWSLVYANGGFPVGAAANFCTIAVPKAGLASYSGDADMVLTNCASPYGMGTTPATLTNLHVGTMNPNNYTFSIADRGVYYGTYAWPSV